MARFEAAIASAFRLRNSVLAEVLLIAVVYGVAIPIVWASTSPSTQPRGTRRHRWRARSSRSGDVVRLREPAGLPVPVLPLVSSIAHLGALSLAGVTDRLESGSHASVSRRWPGISGQHGLCVHCARRGARRTACRTACQLHLLPWHRTHSIQGRDRSRGRIVLVLVFGPLLVFTPELAQAKRRGLRGYGTLAERYVREFDANGCGAVRLPMSRSWAVPTSSH